MIGGGQNSQDGDKDDNEDAEKQFGPDIKLELGGSRSGFVRTWLFSHDARLQSQQIYRANGNDDAKQNDLGGEPAAIGLLKQIGR